MLRNIMLYFKAVYLQVVSMLPLLSSASSFRPHFKHKIQVWMRCSQLLNCFFEVKCFPVLKFTGITANLHVLCVNGLVFSSLRAIRMHVYRQNVLCHQVVSPLLSFSIRWLVYCLITSCPLDKCILFCIISREVWKTEGLARSACTITLNFQFLIYI
jgi:hypothetical protein